ncbi:MAG: hypothetical protein KZQ83_18715 [gamma proteobacterium symbiont of Taylorina sp.]|nr:hypothetical protein [gamma proteobacterium symbiont of Taylorina sp.]
MPLELPEDFNEDDAPQCQGIEQAVKRFENVMLSRIYVQQRLAERLKNSIRIGMLILFLLAIAIFVLLLTLSIQVGRVGVVIVDMNENFINISENMMHINHYMTDMEKQVAFLPKIKNKTLVFDQQMALMNNDLFMIKNNMREMSGHISRVQLKMNEVSESVRQMDGQVQLMNHDTYRMSKPANTMEKFFPF